MTSTPNFSICLIDMPAIMPIDPRDDQNAISFDPEDIAWEVRCAVEGGVDVVKTPYCGDVAAFHQIIENRPVPVVAAGARRSGPAQRVEHPGGQRLQVRL